MLQRNKNIASPSTVSSGTPVWRQRALGLWLVTWFVFSMAFIG